MTGNGNHTTIPKMVMTEDGGFMAYGITHITGEISIHMELDINSGWWFEPLWKIWVRQLGWLETQY